MAAFIDVQASESDLGILLRAAASGKSVAMTEAADRELHGLLGDGHTLTLGTGEILTHVPDVYGTPEFDAAWNNTCAAFARHGIQLAADYRNDRGHARSAAVCFLTVRAEAVGTAAH